jgi:hypothetical protein
MRSKHHRLRPYGSMEAMKSIDHFLLTVLKAPVSLNGYPTETADHFGLPAFRKFAFDCARRGASVKLRLLCSPSLAA